MIQLLSEAMFKLLLLLLCVDVFCVKFPGSCPNVPPTHYKCKEIEVDSFQEVVIGIPFSPERPSNLFCEIIRIADPYSFEFAVDEINNRITSTLIFWNPKGKPYNIHSIGYLDPQVPSISLNSSSRSDILKPISIVDNIRLWCEGEFLLIWSCDQITSTHHEEALMFIVYPKMLRYEANHTAYNEMMERFNVTARKYLNQSEILLQKQIEWTRSKAIEIDLPSDVREIHLAYTLAFVLTLLVCFGVRLWCVLKQEEN